MGDRRKEFLLEHLRTSPLGRPSGSSCVCVLKSCVQRVLNNKGSTGHESSIRSHCMSTAVRHSLK